MSYPSHHYNVLNSLYHLINFQPNLKPHIILKICINTIQTKLGQYRIQNPPQMRHQEFSNKLISQHECLVYLKITIYNLSRIIMIHILCLIFCFRRLHRIPSRHIFCSLLLEQCCCFHLSLYYNYFSDLICDFQSSLT